ncbi:hypothetical protein [Sulfitobacter sp. S190]|uniref:hypothetical protein n=1 Tax=Sulfitobacter sp. S190 TaxID=2867022 RepID=UPI0021A6E229|nr:hypothetical protein [Sulfitobacter sp. S190]UWR21777.1 hypothetical protein K3756_13930 [Sulfitobacter sp. S190]
MRALVACVIVLGLAACADPLSGVDRLSDVDVPASDTAAVAPDAAEVARDGFLGTDAAEGRDLPADAETGADTQATAQSASPDKPRGFFGRLVDSATAAAPEAATPQTAATVVVATRSPDADSADSPQATQPRRGGLFGRGAGSSARNGPDTADVPYGTVLAFGEIARVCEARGKPLGTRVENMGGRGFALYDTNPGIKSKRTFYLTGFDDKCPRQFTAATALVGAPSFYEVLRFGPAGRHLPYAATDKAYDKVKASVCKVGKRKPCDARRIGRLDKNTAFLSAYEYAETNGRWKEFLIHDGAVLASAVKTTD